MTCCVSLPAAAVLINRDCGHRGERQREAFGAGEAEAQEALPSGTYIDMDDGRCISEVGVQWLQCIDNTSLFEVNV